MNLAISSLRTPLSLVSLLLGRARYVSRSRLPVQSPADTQTLQQGAILVVLNPLRHRVECLNGSVWITHDGDPKDIILDGGQSYQAERDSRMLVYALTEASLRFGRRIG